MINGNFVLLINGQLIIVDNEKFIVLENGMVILNGWQVGWIDIRMEEDVCNLKWDGNDLYSMVDGFELLSVVVNF